MRFRLVCTLLVGLLCAGCGDAPAVKLVKAGKVAVCGERNIEQMVSGVFKDARWSEQTENQKILVQVSGTMPVSGKEITAVLRFAVKGEGYTVEDLAYNGVPQNMATLGMLMIEMCAKKP